MASDRLGAEGNIVNLKIMLLPKGKHREEGKVS
jgi:hypothetical protein